jgi:hypothetical protein
LVHLFDPIKSSLDIPTERGDLLALTDRRLIAFTDEEGKAETRMVSLNRIEGASVRSASRNPKSLYQGMTLILVGIMVYLVMGTFSTSGTVAAFLGGAIGFLGILFIGRFLAWEQGGELAFLVGTWEVCFPYRSNKAAAQVHQLIHRLFQLQAGEFVPSLTLAASREVSPNLQPTTLVPDDGILGESVREAPSLGPKRDPPPGQNLPPDPD